MYCQNVVVDYQINPEFAYWIWINVEEWDTNLVKQTSIESGIKAVTKQFEDTDVSDRSKMKQILLRWRMKLAPLFRKHKLSCLK